MAKIEMLNMAGENAGTLELNDAIFGIEPNEFAVHEVIKNFLANQRQGTQSAKTRGEVRGGGRKPFRQKGTGRHRQGSTTDPSQVGGGVAFAPKPRDYSYTLNKKVRRLALKSALSAKAAADEIVVIEGMKMDAPKTRTFAELLGKIGVTGKALVVTEGPDANVIKSARNIAGVQTTMATILNPYMVLNTTKLVVAKEALEKIEEVYA